MKRALARAARRVIVLADHTKIGRDELMTVVPLDVVDTLITDAGVDLTWQTISSQRDLTSSVPNQPIAGPLLVAPRPSLHGKARPSLLARPTVRPLVTHTQVVRKQFSAEC